MIARYEGWPGTGLRLEDPDNPYYGIDIGGSHGKSGGMSICVMEDIGVRATVELAPEDVAHLGAMCSQWLAWHHAGRETRRR